MLNYEQMATNIKKPATSALALGALGVVFGDLGTSPLYTLEAIFGRHHLLISQSSVYGLISMILWSVTIVVTIKYIGFLMRADNHGEGGIMALVALVRRPDNARKRRGLMILLGLAGIALFYGDGAITPAISVLSAVEGISLSLPSFTWLILPITVVILLLLFSLQQRGTGSIGKLFGPVMLAWFIVSGLGGLSQIISHPGILQALSPWQALGFFINHPLATFLAMGGVILAITGAEALYADMGHFGRNPITRAWLIAVFPALLLNYMGQGALITANPSAISSPYFLLFPVGLQLPVVILATAATLIASQSVIAGVFSLTRQSIHLGFAPRLTIKHTSSEEIGQIYINALNWVLCAVVILLVLAFRSSASLAGAYGMAVSGTLAIDTFLFLSAMRLSRNWSWSKLLPVALLLLPLDLLFVSSSLSKFIHGGWVPILIAAISLVALTTWTKAHRLMNLERERMEGSLDDFVSAIRHNHNLTRVPGTAIYIGHHGGVAPLALKATLEDLHELHENVIVVTILTLGVPHVPAKERVSLDNLGSASDGITHIILNFGFKDIPNIPLALETAQKEDKLEKNFDPYKVSYFVSRSKPAAGVSQHISRWRKALFGLMVRNAATPTDYYKLPLEHTLEINAYVPI